MNSVYFATAMLFGHALLAQETMHESNTGGQSQTVTVFTKSHVHIDRLLLENLGDSSIKLPEVTEVWRHGHPGPRVLRVIQPEWKKSFHSRALTGTTIDTNDLVEIEVVDAQGAKLGVLTLSRQPRDKAGVFTSGHAAFAEKYGPPGTKVDLRACFNTCPICREDGPARERAAAACRQARETVDNVLNNPPTGKLPKSDTVWIYTAEPDAGKNLGWVAKSPDAEGIRAIIAAKLPSPVKFDFSLTNAGDVQNIAMKELRVKQGGKNGPVVFTAPMPKFSTFEVCSINEDTGASACDPLPECDTFWRRHFNKGCKLYGGAGVFTGKAKHKGYEHRH